MTTAKQLFREIETYAQIIVDTIRDPLLILDRELRARSSNRAFYKTFETTPEETVGNLLPELGAGQWNIPALLAMLNDIAPKDTEFDDYEVTREFPKLGRRTVLLSARKLYRPGNRTVLLALAIEDITERRRVEADLQAAARRDRRIATMLQRSLMFMPPENAFRGLAVKTLYETATDEALIGGDFWDAFAFQGRSVALVLGDVMGKGIGAAVFTAEIKYTLRAFMRGHEHPARVLSELNDYLCESYDLYREGDTQFEDAPVCLALAVINRATGTGTVSTAGMEPLLVLRTDGQAEEVAVHGFPLGIERNLAYDEATFQLGHGDMILLATDGMTEARNNDKFLGYAGLMRLAQAGRTLGSLEQMGHSILDGARAFAGGKFHDDACLLLAQRK